MERTLKFYDRKIHAYKSLNIFSQITWYKREIFRSQYGDNMFQLPLLDTGTVWPQEHEAG